MIKRFKETGKVRFQPGKGRKLITLVLVDASRQLLPYSHKHESLGFVAHVQFLNTEAILIAPSQKCSET